MDTTRRGLFGMFAAAGSVVVLGVKPERAAPPPIGRDDVGGTSSGRLTTGQLPAHAHTMTAVHAPVHRHTVWDGATYRYL